MANMSIFELIMLAAFGLSWPFAIHKSWTSRQTGGKSPVFLIALIIGYLAGITHKVLYSRDILIGFYALNLIMVSIDLALYFRNTRLEKARVAQTDAGQSLLEKGQPDSPRKK